MSTSSRGLCVSATYRGDAGAQSWTAELIVCAAGANPGWALDVSFLVDPDLPRSTAGGVIGQWGDPLRFGSWAEERRPHSFFWSWRCIMEALDRQQPDPPGA